MERITLKKIIEQNTIKNNNPYKWYQLSRMVIVNTIDGKNVRYSIIDDDCGFIVYMNNEEFFTVLRPFNKTEELGMLVNSKASFLKTMKLFCDLIGDKELFYSIKSFINKYNN